MSICPQLFSLSTPQDLTPHLLQPSLFSLLTFFLAVISWSLLIGILALFWESSKFQGRWTCIAYRNICCNKLIIAVGKSVKLMSPRCFVSIFVNASTPLKVGRPTHLMPPQQVHFACPWLKPEVALKIIPTIPYILRVILLILWILTIIIYVSQRNGNVPPVPIEYAGTATQTRGGNFFNSIPGHQRKTAITFHFCTVSIWW